MNNTNRAKYLSRLGVDFIVVTVCFISASLIFPHGDSFFSKRNIIFFFYVSSFWYFASQVTFLYNEFLTRSLSQEIITVIKTIIVQNAFVIIALFFLSRSPLETKWFAACFIVLQFITLPFIKYFTRWYYALNLSNGKRTTSLLVIGAGEIGMSFNSIISNNYKLGYTVTGFLDDNVKPGLNGQYLGKIDDLNSIFQKREIDDVIIALPNNAVDKIKYAIKISEENGKRVRLIPDYFRLSPSISISTFDTLPLISLRTIPLDNNELRFFKRLFDILFSLFLFVFFFSWLFIIIAIVIKATSKGSIFFLQERWGINGKKIMCYKFRSMFSNKNNEIDENGNFNPTIKNDPRITKVGVLLRKHNLDELPQFLNVLKGEMSIIGPRPHASLQNEEMKQIIKNYMLRHLVKPGITGWAQVNGYRGETKELKMMQKRIDFDIWYIENWSFWLDCQIIIQTVINMIKGDKNAY